MGKNCEICGRFLRKIVFPELSFEGQVWETERVEWRCKDSYKDWESGYWEHE